MVIARSLLLGSLGLLATSTGTSLFFHQKDNISFLFSKNPHASIYKLGLNCGEASAEGGECHIYPGRRILVKRGQENHFEIGDLGSGRIKLYRVGEDNYKEGFKFLIEDNDITGTGNNKLEEMETYEVTLGEDTDEALRGKYYLSRKTEAKDEIKNALGLPWDLPTENTVEQENIEDSNLNKIKFDGKEGTVSHTGSLKLTITKETSRDDYPLGYKFTFKNTGNSNSVLTLSTNRSMAIKSGIDIDFKIKKEGLNLSLEKAWTVDTLASKVGLKKSNGYWDVGEKGINVKKNNAKETGKTKNGNPTGKIKVYEGVTGYNQGFKFSIEGGDVDLKTSDGTTITTLEEFETYEISKDNDENWYLSRKTDSREKIKTSLGIPCDLPENNSTSSECNITADNIGQIKFEGSGEVTTSGSPKLTIHIDSSREDYPHGYRFVFTSTSGESSITVGSVKTVLKENLDVEFKIKKKENNEFTLEKAWTPDSLMKLVYLEKEGEDTWVIKDGILSIKQNNNKSSSVSKGSGANSAKIKVYEGESGYNQGFKFVVEGGDINFEADNSISQLTKYETYEVVRDDDGIWYFTRKQNSSETIKKILGFPESCINSASNDCALDSADKLKAIKFEGKGDNAEVTVNGGDDYSKIKMKISKAYGNDFPRNYKFTLESEKEINIPQSNATPITIKANTNTEFKLKESGNNLTLEKAWTPVTLGKKINLTCTSQDNKCTLGNKINVYESEEGYVIDASITNGSGKKISYEENADGYNHGIKFSVEEDIDLGSWSSSGRTAVNSITKGDNVSYEIMEKTIKNKTKWYLVKKGN